MNSLSDAPESSDIQINQKQEQLVESTNNLEDISTQAYESETDDGEDHDNEDTSDEKSEDEINLSKFSETSADFADTSQRSSYSNQNGQNQSNDSISASNSNHGSPQKTVELLLYLQNRLNFANMSDEWENDEDNGYVCITVTEEEYSEYDQVSKIYF